MAHQEISSIRKSPISREERTSMPSNAGEPATNRPSPVDITMLIRSIQRAEGNPDCFRKAQGDCREMECWWRTYCLEDKPI